MVSKKFKQDFLKIQRALEDKLQKNPKQLLSNLGMKKTCNSVKIRKRLLTALLRTVNCQKNSMQQNTQKDSLSSKGDEVSFKNTQLDLILLRLN